MADRLIIDDDEAVGLALDLAERLGLTPDEVVVRALQSFGARAAPRLPSIAEQPVHEALRALARQAASHRRHGATSDHADLYGEDGLPA